jgi:hypothetical protein
VSDTVCIAFSSVLDPAAQAHQESNHRADQKHDEQDFRDAGSANRNSAEAKKRGYQRDYKKYSGVVKHVRTLNDLKQQPAGGSKYLENKPMLQSVGGGPERRT